jgi:hypothetical protein
MKRKLLDGLRFSLWLIFITMLVTSPLFIAAVIISLFVEGGM